MKFTVSRKELKPRGYKYYYKYDALYHRCLVGEYDNITSIWLFVSGSTIHLNDWYGMSGPIVEFFKQHRNDKVVIPKYSPSLLDIRGQFVKSMINDGFQPLYTPEEALHISVNGETGEIAMYDYEERLRSSIDLLLHKETRGDFAKHKIKRKMPWRDLYLEFDKMDVLIEELDWLQDKK